MSQWHLLTWQLCYLIPGDAGLTGMLMEREREAGLPAGRPSARLQVKPQPKAASVGFRLEIADYVNLHGGARLRSYESPPLDAGAG